MNIWTCRGVVVESESGVGVEGEALAVKKEVPVVDATLSRCESVVIDGRGISEKTDELERRTGQYTAPSRVAVLSNHK